MLIITNYQENENQNCNKVSPHSSQNGHHLKSLQILNAREDGEKKEPSYVIAGNVNWCSYYKEQY